MSQVTASLVKDLLDRTGLVMMECKRALAQSEGDIDKAIEESSAKIMALGEREINSRDIGEEVMRALKKLDKVAYIRFASVYKSFSDPEDFNAAIKDLG